MKYTKFRQLHKKNEEEVVAALERAAVSSSESIQADLMNEVYKIHSCGSYINTIRCMDCGTNHFKSFVRCKSKFCMLCQRVKSTLWVACLYSWIKQWLEQGNYVVFLNLTLKDTDGLSEGLKQLEGAWRLMTGTKYKKAFLSLFPGGFKSVEVKTGKNSKQWHPHIHALVLKTRYSKDTDFLHYVWPRCVAEMGGFATNLEIMAFNKKPGEAKEDYELRLFNSVKEVCKYITKFDWRKEAPERIAELYTTLKGKRQYAVWGQLRHVRDEVETAFKTKSDAECKDFVCQKCGGHNGVPNQLFKAVWENIDEVFMPDVKDSAPEEVVSGTALERLKVINAEISMRQKIDERPPADVEIIQKRQRPPQ